MEACLYDEANGFYTARGGSAGRRGDFITSAEVGPLFGTVLARWLDAVWEDLGRPDPFEVADVGAGPGTLGRSLRAGAGRCREALQLTLVERSAAGRARHDPEVGASVADLGQVATAHVIVANELLDNLPVRLFEHRDTGWVEVWIGPVGVEHRPAEALLPGCAAALANLGPGAEVPVAEVAGRWVDDALRVLEPGGRLLVLDYGATTAELATRSRDGWLRTFRQQQRGSGPFDDPGEQDLTCEVPVDQLPAPASVDRQTDWLRRWGIDELVAEGRRIWQERAGIGDLAALRARSRVSEAAALLDPAGLGAFLVMEWRAGRGHTE
jgi:SAM-dependent MidA family methyltransferase